MSIDPSPDVPRGLAPPGAAREILDALENMLGLPGNGGARFQRESASAAFDVPAGSEPPD